MIKKGAIMAWELKYSMDTTLNVLLLLVVPVSIHLPQFSIDLTELVGRYCLSIIAVYLLGEEEEDYS